ncbi:amidohydrolase family protein [Alcanivorax sp. 1008]|uniref:amidohydrolase family protein n=1 Tax=Alcanivorax sp. 1008 TaxID=2816853 RepID=UPI001DA33E8F|nr:amidohydrolase family protein [Alcanivorax sp. 1008]MCC1498205.1 amidohydrolase family protein [Alcanivorax sp. 1008]
MEALRADSTRVVNLDGKALLPGVIDARGHVANVGLQALAADLLPPPDGEGQSVDSLVSLLTAWHAQINSLFQAAGWIIGFGYDDSQLASATRRQRVLISCCMQILLVLQNMMSAGLEVVISCMFSNISFPQNRSGASVKSQSLNRLSIPPQEMAPYL